jgi:methionine-rich copper-binding protein CopC
MGAVLSPLFARRPSAIILAAGMALSFALGASLVSSVISAAPASAHAALVKITPDADAQLSTAPTEVMLEFDEPVSATFATVLVTTTGGVSVARGKATVLGAKVTQALSPDLASGLYRVAYRVVSNDGHPVSGESRFTLALTSGTSPVTSGGANGPSASVSAGPATPSLPAVAVPSTRNRKPGQGGWLSRVLVPMAASVVLLAMCAGLMVWDRRRRPT